MTARELAVRILDLVSTDYNGSRYAGDDNVGTNEELVAEAVAMIHEYTSGLCTVSALPPRGDNASVAGLRTVSFEKQFTIQRSQSPGVCSITTLDIQ